MIKTSVGLPNNCSATGKPIKESFWYADSEDAAIAGLGICDAEYKRRNGKAEPKTDAGKTDAGKTDESK